MYAVKARTLTRSYFPTLLFFDHSAFAIPHSRRAGFHPGGMALWAGGRIPIVPSYAFRLQPYVRTLVLSYASRPPAT
jgi:hypothetical protein